MPGPDLIEGYLAELAGSLPVPIVAEVADGLYETYEFHRVRGLDDQDAARAAVAEFGAPAVVVTRFLAVNPARRAARALLLTGPVVGATWAGVLILRRAWQWPVADAARVGVGAMVLTGVALLAAGVFGARYRSARRTGTAGCLVVLAVDLSLLGYVISAGMLTAWPVLLAASLSTTRVAFTVSRIPQLLADG